MLSPAQQDVNIFKILSTGENYLFMKREKVVCWMKEMFIFAIKRLAFVSLFSAVKRASQKCLFTCVKELREQ